MSKLRNAWIKLSTFVKQRLERLHIKGTDFCIISNNCWAGIIYQKFGLRYNTPTAGLFIMDDDYIKFVERLDHYIDAPLQFIPLKEANYYPYLSRQRSIHDDYPVARLGDIEIYFLHYATEQEAREKWQRRCARFKQCNRDHLLIKMSQRDDMSHAILDRFAALPYPHKICFTPLEHDAQCVVTVPEMADLYIQGGDETPFTLRHINLYHLINSLYA